MKSWPLGFISKKLSTWLWVPLKEDQNHPESFQDQTWFSTSEPHPQIVQQIYSYLWSKSWTCLQPQLLQGFVELKRRRRSKGSEPCGPRSLGLVSSLTRFPNLHPSSCLESPAHSVQSLRFLICILSPDPWFVQPAFMMELSWELGGASLVCLQPSGSETLPQC